MTAQQISLRPFPPSASGAAPALRAVSTTRPRGRPGRRTPRSPRACRPPRRRSRTESTRRRGHLGGAEHPARPRDTARWSWCALGDRGQARGGADLGGIGAGSQSVRAEPASGAAPVSMRTNSIVRYPWTRGDARRRRGDPSSGPTPYGFAVAADGTLVVTEAFGAQVGRAPRRRTARRAGAAPLALGGERAQRDLLAVITPDGRYAYTTNFADGACPAGPSRPTASWPSRTPPPG